MYLPHHFLCLILLFNCFYSLTDDKITSINSIRLCICLTAVFNLINLVIYHFFWVTVSHCPMFRILSPSLFIYFDDNKEDENLPSDQRRVKIIPVQHISLTYWILRYHFIFSPELTAKFWNKSWCIVRLSKDEPVLVANFCGLYGSWTNFEFHVHTEADSDGCWLCFRNPSRKNFCEVRTRARYRKHAVDKC